ncbi:MAG: alpha/beta hydrolase [Pseudomonadota bacterium]
MVRFAALFLVVLSVTAFWLVASGKIYGVYRLIYAGSHAPDQILSYPAAQGGHPLDVLVHLPAEWSNGADHPAIVLFHGGAWRAGSPWQLSGLAHGLADQGYVVLLPTYRMAVTDKAGISDSVADAAAFFGWLPDQVEALKIVPSRLAVGGSSAGGFLALAAYAKHGEAPPPGPVVLINPAINLDKGTLTKNWNRLSQPSNITPEVLLSLDPANTIGHLGGPCLILHGTDDRVIPLAWVEAHAEAWEQNGGGCTLSRFEGRGHGFATNPFGNADRRAVVEQVSLFLRSHTAE